MDQNQARKSRQECFSTISQGYDDREISQTQDPSPFFGANFNVDNGATEDWNSPLQNWCGSGTSGNTGNGGSPTSGTIDLGGLDLYGFCGSLGYSSASLDGSTAYDWHCDDDQGNTYPIDMNAACLWQYPTAANVNTEVGDVNDPNSWQCYGQQTG